MQKVNLNIYSASAFARWDLLTDDVEAPQGVASMGRTRGKRRRKSVFRIRQRKQRMSFIPAVAPWRAVNHTQAAASGPASFRHDALLIYSSLPPLSSLTMAASHSFTPEALSALLQIPNAHSYSHHAVSALRLSRVDCSRKIYLIF